MAFMGPTVTRDNKSTEVSEDITEDGNYENDQLNDCETAE